MLTLFAVLLSLSMFVGVAASAIGFTAWPLAVPVLYIIFGFDLYLTLFISLTIDCGNALVIALLSMRNGETDINYSSVGIELVGYNCFLTKL